MDGLFTDGLCTAAVAVGGEELLAGVRLARWKAWTAVKKCLLKFSIIVDLSVVSVFPECSGQLEGGTLILHGFYSVPKLLGISVAGCKFLFKKASLCFPN
jgi:hypothetical protein